MIAGFLMAASALLSPAGAQEPAPSTAQPQQQKPNILFIMGDDIGRIQVGVYHRNLALGVVLERPEGRPVVVGAMTGGFESFHYHATYLAVLISHIAVDAMAH